MGDTPELSSFLSLVTFRTGRKQLAPRERAVSPRPQSKGVVLSLHSSEAHVWYFEEGPDGWETQC